MQIKTALYNADHLEYGIVTIPFPIPKDQYDSTIKMLEAFDIGDPRERDCTVREVLGPVPSLKCLEGTQINVDELDYLVKRLDSFSDDEIAQFQAMAFKLGKLNMTGRINLTFCCQEATVITDFSDLEGIGRAHYMNLYGGGASIEELEQLDGVETALLLITENEGTAYRRCIWTQHGEKRPVWRCVSRLSYGKKYCLHSPTLDEESLQKAILGAINASMDNRTVLESRITAVMEQELLPVAGETMSLADVERALEDLGRQFDSLLKEAASPERKEEYTERFRAVSTSMAELKNRRERLKAIYQENEKASQQLQAISAALEGASADITEWDESTVYQLLE